MFTRIGLDPLNIAAVATDGNGIVLPQVQVQSTSDTRWG